MVCRFQGISDPPNGYIVLGDPAYRGLHPRVITTYTGANLMTYQVNFNYSSSRVRQIVERTIRAGQLKWRVHYVETECLLYMFRVDSDKPTHWVKRPICVHGVVGQCLQLVRSFHYALQAGRLRTFFPSCDLFLSLVHGDAPPFHVVYITPTLISQWRKF